MFANWKMTKESVMGLIRHTLTSIGGYLVIEGVLTEPTMTTMVGAAMTLVGYAWSYFTKE